MTLLDDLTGEHDALDAIVSDLDEATWRAPTPAEGWDVRDSVAHLAWSDELAVLALSSPDRFAAILTDPEPALAAWVSRGRSSSGAEVLAWWRDARQRTLDRLAFRAPKDRVPWAAGPMSPASFATARLMETWAHGQDVRDALGLAPSATARLRHVAELGVKTRPFSYRVRGLEPPSGDVRVELAPPNGGATWSWGAPDAPHAVRGPALDFGLVVTQRRHLDDTDLVASGAARHWLLVAQSFAGPPTGPPSRRMVDTAPESLKAFKPFHIAGGT